MLVNAIGLVLLYFSCAVIVRLDRTWFGTYWTPTTLLMLPFVAVATAHFFLGAMLGFAPLRTEVILVWIVGSFVFCGVGHGLRYVWLGDRQVLPPRRSSDEPINGPWPLWSVVGGLVSIVLLAYAFVLLSGLGGITAIVSSDFADQWGSGWPAHVRMILEIIMVLVIGTTPRWAIGVLASLVLMFFVMLLYQSLGAMLAPLIAGALARIFSRRYQPRVSHFVAAVGGGFLLFQLVYLVGWAVLNPSSLIDPDVYFFYARHFMAYIFAGIMGFSESLRLAVTWLNGDATLLFAPVYNLFAVVFDRPLVMVADLAQDHYVQIASYGVGSNVNTFFGTIIMAVGPLHGLIVVFTISLVAHAMLIGWARSSNLWLLIAYCYWGALLAFGWFEYYFWLLRSVELPVLCGLIAMAQFYLGSSAKPRTNAPTIDRDPLRSGQPASR